METLCGDEAAYALDRADAEALRACDEQLGLIIDLFPDDLMEQFDTDLSPDSRANGSQSIGFQPGMSRPQGRQGLGRRLADRLAAM